MIARRRTIDWAGLSPLIALLGGALARPRRSASAARAGCARASCRSWRIARFGAAIGLSIWQWGERKDLIEGALRLDELTLVLHDASSASRASRRRCWPGAHIAPREAAHGEFYACC